VSVLVTAAEMRAFDRHTIDVIGVPGAVLMETAGHAVAEVVRSLEPARVLVVCGVGNNGGDGCVAARWLHGWGLEVRLVLVGAVNRVHGDAALHLHAAQRAGVPLVELDDLGAIDAAFGPSLPDTVLVDALLGTGLGRPVEGLFAEVIDRINEEPGVKVAVDVPSGLDSDRGVPLGSCVRADRTVTFGFCKRGLAVAPGFTFAGRVDVVDIGIPVALARGCKTVLLEAEVLRPFSGALGPLGHKGTHGHLLLLAGSPGKSGAAALAGRAALRCGAGLCTVAADKAALAAMMAVSATPELMTLALAGGLDAELASLEAALDGKRALAIGPGLSTSGETGQLVSRLVQAALSRALPLVLDADGLNHLATNPQLLTDGATNRRIVVLTPHPGEAARLLGRSIADVQADRVASALELAATYGAVVALKGARTLVAAPDGRLAVCPTGNAGLGTGGTGDVLTGCIGALLLQGSDGFEAATAGVYLHGAAGDLVAARSGQRGLLASDVIEALPQVLR